jgi:hypothetical protein
VISTQVPCVATWHILKCADLSFRNGTECCNTLQRHNTENSKQIFPEKKLRGLSPYNHVYVSDLYIPKISLPHKVLTYIEYRAVSGVFRTIDPHPLSTQRVCLPHAPKVGGGGVHTRRAVWEWGVNISEDARHWIGLLKKIPLRSAYSAGGKHVDRSWKYINPSQTHECGNWD